MPYVKPTVHISRLASTALKTFTHGYAQTVVAASQSSYAAQNTSAAPIADHLIARFRKSEKSRLQNVYTHVDGARQAGTAGLATGRSDATQDGLDKYFDAWQKHQRNGGTKEWQQFQFARRLEWQPPTTVPAQQNESFDAEELVAAQEDEPLAAPSLKRSYTTSALDNFEKAFLNDEVAEAAALEQVNNAIAEEIQRSKSPSATSLKDSALGSELEPTGINSDNLSNADSLESDYYTNQLLQLSESRQYGEIPAVFQGMLRAGVKQPSPSAYRALLLAAIELTHGKHLKAPKALEVYSDMLRRKVVPDVETYGMLIGLLSTRASETMSMRKSLDERLGRYGGIDEAGKFMFRSTQSEYAMLVEDNSLSIALKMFERAMQTSDTIPIDACASLVIASAEQGRVDEMTRVYQYMESKSSKPLSVIYPPMVAAFGAYGDLRNAVEVYDEYKELAIANNAGENAIVRVDYQIYAAVIKAYGAADRLKGGLKFLASIQSGVATSSELEKLREVVALDALLPLALKDPTFRDAIDLTGSLTGRALTSALAKISIDAADRNVPHVSLQAFDNLARQSKDLAAPSMAVLAMHVRNANVEAAEPFWRILESAMPTLDFIEPTTMRTVALIGIGQSERGLRQSRRMFARIRESQSFSVEEMHDQMGEAIELIGTFMLKQNNILLPEASVELLRMMVENGGLVSPISDHLVARFNPEYIARLSQVDLELLLKVQSSMILDEMSADIAGPARFGCLLENVVSRSMMPSTETETVIERTLINIDRSELSRMWNNYRYPTIPAQAVFAPGSAPFQAPMSAEDAYDPYLNRTDVKASNMINELLDRPHGRGTNEALAKFRNMRRIGRVPRMFIYGKLIEAAAKENKLNLAHDVLEMAKSDVPFDARYRLVRFGWQQILDHMVAGCLNVGRRDLASRYHQDMIDMGCAPSANTFGLYITTLKENTKTFDEASEAVKIFLRAKAEGVEPSSFLYNALIGKLGKARRIDDCLFYFAEMRNLGVRPTSVTYGTIVNALCRVSDDKFAEEIFEEMESCANYKPRPAPYHSLMQFFLSTKRDRGKVLAYYERMLSKGIEPTIHTYKLLIDTHATLEPVNMPAAEQVLEDMQASGIKPEAVHYSSLIHAKGCVQHDMDAALALFNKVLAESVRPLPCLYQAVFESLNANHRNRESEALVADMRRRNVEITPYVANALIHGCITDGETAKAESVFKNLPVSRREPSTYEAMVRAYLAGGERQKAQDVVKEALGRGYPGAVAGKIAELVR